MNETKLKITQILTDKLALDEDVLQDDLKFYNDLGVDSLDFYEVISDIEKAFNISIPDEDAARLNTLGLMVAYIEKKAPQHSLLQVA
jgi:acyl carrier protein